MNRLVRRASLFMLPALALGGVAAGLTAAPAAHAAASGPHITAYFESGSIEVLGSGYTQGANVNIEGLNSTFTRAEATTTAVADSSGQFQAWLMVDRCAGPDLWHFYNGQVTIAADGAPGPTAWASGTLGPDRLPSSC
jgi:hypothetical protein